MNFRTFKSKNILAIALLVSFASCEKNEMDFSQIYENEGKFLFSKEVSFCQRSPDIEFRTNLFEYDNQHNLIEKISYFQTNPDSKRIFSFNRNNQALEDSVFYYNNNSWKLDRYYKYFYKKNLLSEKITYNSVGKINRKTIYKYSGSKLIWEEFYNHFENEFRFQYAHKFEYNRYGKVTKRESYTTEEKDKVYDTFIYTYKNGRLASEIRIIITGETSYVKKYFYNSEGLIDEIIKDGNVTEKNFYEKGKLIEKHTFYFGIDPGFSPCSGNMILKYEY